ncbi:MAG TPA: M48 family metalloprotease, partial [Gemmatimonadaceae bacterium]|nr:M48 family metalloprotease [Gemmatimonadaceae bacterium]
MRRGARVSSAEQQALVREVCERLAAAAERPDYDWEFTVVEAPEAEAVAFPGGKVIVYSGLLPVAEDSAGLAAVMGHEIAHVLARHGAERWSQPHLRRRVGDGRVRPDRASVQRVDGVRDRLESPPEFLSTHPVPNTRLANLHAWLP